jgi:hypothetical protein
MIGTPDLCRLDGLAIVRATEPAVGAPLRIEVRRLIDQKIAEILERERYRLLLRGN